MLVFADCLSFTQTQSKACCIHLHYFIMALISVNPHCEIPVCFYKLCDIYSVKLIFKNKHKNQQGGENGTLVWFP